MENGALTKYFNQEAVIVAPPVPLERAIEIFNELADMEDIAFGYANDGCYARAHIMCRRLIEKNLMPKKAWAFEGEKRLCVKMASREVSWWYHVAPALSVEMPDKIVQDMVFDPSLFDGPVSLLEWGRIMNAPMAGLQIVPFGVAPEGHVGDYDPEDKTLPEMDRRAEKRMGEYLEKQERAPRKVFPSQSRQQLLQGQERGSPQAQGGQAQGKTWMTYVESAQPSFVPPPAPPPVLPKFEPKPRPGLWQRMKSMVIP